jgi:septum formation protein
MQHLHYPFSIILGSASPRRRDLLASIGFTFQVAPINANEDFPSDLRGEEIPFYLAEKKSLAYPVPLKENELLITSDTVVWLKNQVLNKPENHAEAKKMLLQLSGNLHTVYTGVCLRTYSKKVTFVDATNVFFRDLKEEEIEYYIHHFPVFDKAGSYGAQDWIGCVAIERIEGSYFNVMGLPVHRLYNELVRIAAS